MAEEALRDLVVRLSLNGTNYTKNITAAQKLTRELESEFKLAAAGNKEFETSIEGLSHRVKTYGEEITQQERIIKEYEKIVTEAKSNFAKADAEQAAAQDRLNNAMANGAGTDELVRLGGELQKCQLKAHNLGNSVVDATRHLNEAKIKMQELNVAQTDTNAKLESAKAGWNAYNGLMQISGRNIAGLSTDMKVANAMFDANAAGMKNMSETLRGVQMQYDSLTQRVSIAKNIWDENANSLDIAQRKLAAAKFGGDTDQIAEAEADVQKYRTAVASSRAEYLKLNAELRNVGTSLVSMKNGWEVFTLGVTNSEKAIGSLSTQLQIASTMYDANIAGMSGYGQTIESVEEKYRSLTERLQIASNIFEENAEALANAKMQLSAAQSAGDDDRIKEAEENVRKYSVAVASSYAEQQNLGKQVKETGNILASMNAGWLASTNDITNADNAITKLAMDMQVANYDFQTSTAGMQNVNETLKGVQAQYDSLAERVRIASETYKQNVAALNAANTQLASARVGGDKKQIVDAEANVRKYTVAVAQSRAEEAKLRAEQDKVRASLEAMKGGWEGSANAAKRYKDSVEAMSRALAVSDARYKSQAATMNGTKNSAEQLRIKYNSLTEKSGLLYQKLQALTAQLAASKQQLIAAEQAGDTEKVNKASEDVNKLTVEIAKLNAELAETNRSAEETKSQALGKIIPALKDFDWYTASSGEKLQKVGSIVQSVGAKMSVLSAGVIALGKSVVQSAIDFEYSFSYVRKTVQTTEEGYTQLEEASKRMSTTLATSTDDINNIMMTAGQLGIEAKNVEAFAEAMAKVGLAANDLSATEASTQFAQFMNIMGGEQDTARFNSLASAVVEVGNTTATTESKVSAMMLRLAGAGRQIGMTEQDIVGIAAGLSSVGIEAQMGGSSFSKALVNIEKATVSGGKELQQYADIAGMTTDEFKALWDANPTEAFLSFVEGLSRLSDEGISTIQVLEDIGISEIRLRDTMLRATGSIDKMRTAVNTARDAYEDTASFENRVNELLNTTKNRVENLKNRVKLAALEFGNTMLPYFERGVGIVEELVEKLSGMTDEQRNLVITIAGVVAAIGPVLTIAGTVVKAVGTIKTMVSSLALVLGKSIGIFNGAKVASALLSVGWVALGAAAVAAVAHIVDVTSGAKAARDAMKQLKETTDEWSESVTTSYENSKGMSAFGLTDESFSVNAQSGKDWLQTTKEVWSDGKKETNQIVNDTVKGFTSGTDKIRNSLETLKNSEYGSLYGDIDEDIANLDMIDKEVERLLKKRQNKMLSEEDQELLDSLVKQRSDIILKYRLVEDGSEGGYEKIIQDVQSAMSRDADQMQTYSIGFAATTQGFGAYIDSLNEEYDARYAIISAIEDETERQAELQKLQDWYNENSDKGVKEYNDALMDLAEETGIIGEDGTFTKTAQKLQNVYDAINGAAGESAGAEEIQALNDALSELTPKELVELNASISAMKLAAEDAGVALPEPIQNIVDLLDKTKKAALETSDAFDTDIANALETAFGNLDKETVEVYAQLNCENLSTAYDEWAEGEHAEIIPSLEDDTITVDGIEIDGMAKFVGEVTAEGEELFVEGNENIKTGAHVFYVTADNKAYEVTDNDGVKTKAYVGEVTIDGKIVAKNGEGGEVVVAANVHEATANSEEIFVQDAANITTTARVSEVTIDENTKMPEITVEASVGNKNPETVFSAGKKDTNNGEGGYWQGAGMAGVKYISDYADALREYNAARNKYETNSSNENWSELEGKNATLCLLRENLINTLGIGEGFFSIAQYIAGGLASIQSGDMTEEEQENFIGFLGRLIETMDSISWSASAEDFFSSLANGLNQLGDGSFAGVELNKENIVPTLKNVLVFAGTDTTDDWKYINREGNLFYPVIGENTKAESKTSAEEVKDIVAEELSTENFEEIGENASQGLIDGMDAKEEEVKEAAVRAGGAAVNTLKITLKVKSPSEVFKEIGEYSIEGMIQGIDNKTSALCDSLRNAARMAVRAAKDELEVKSPSRVFRDEVGAMMMKGIGVGVVQETENQRRIIANASRSLTASAKGETYNYGSTNNSYTYDNKQSVEITGNTFQIRDDHDISQLASEIAALMRKNKRAIGAWA